MLAAITTSSEGQPVGCLDLLIGCMRDLEEDGEWLVRALSRRHTVLTSAWMRFVTTYRSSNQLERLSDVIDHCRCNEGPPLVRDAPSILHEDTINARSSSAPSNIGELIASMCRWILQVLENNPQLSSLYRSRIPRQRWPHHMHDLVPFDHVQSWHALGAWEYLVETPPSKEPGLLSILLLETFGTYWLKSLLKSPALLLWMRNTIDTYNLNHNPDVNPHNTNNMSMMFAILELEIVAGLLHELSTVLFDDELLWWASNLEDKEDSLTMVVNLCILSLKTVDMARENQELGIQSQSIEQISKRFAGFAGRIVACAPHLREEGVSSRLPHVIHEATKSVMWEMRDSATQMVNFGVSPQWRGRCHGPGCTKTAQEVGYRLPVCSHCKIAAYCSRKCQRNGWRYSDAPHREVCDSGLWIRQKQEENRESLQMLFESFRSNASDGHAKAIHYLQILHESQFKQLREPHPLKCFTLILIYNIGAEKEVDEYEMDVSRPIVPRSGYYDDNESDDA
jgi:hypothetical protein